MRGKHWRQRPWFRKGDQGGLLEVREPAFQGLAAGEQQGAQGCSWGAEGSSGGRAPRGQSAVGVPRGSGCR